jgi:DNA-binding winged helix-turn-helix (wHTH) protein
VYVSKLRTKLEAAMPDRRFIHTHPGFGYRFQPQPLVGASARAKADREQASPRAIDQRGPSRNFHTHAVVDVGQ